MPEMVRLSRRTLAMFLAGASGMMAQEESRTVPSPETQDAAAALRKNVEALAGVKLEREIEPSFRFEA